MKPFTQLTDDELLRLARDALATPDAPEPVIQAAIALWPQAPQGSLAGSFAALAGGVVGAGMRRLRAVLEVDSARPGSALGLRGMPSATRHLLFSVEGCDIDLRIVSGPAGHAVSGQLLGPEEGGRVELRAAGADPATPPLADATIDALGEFRLAPTSAAAVVLSLHLPGGVIDLPAIEFVPLDA